MPIVSPLFQRPDFANEAPVCLEFNLVAMPRFQNSQHDLRFYFQRRRLDDTSSLRRLKSVCSITRVALPKPFCAALE